MNTFETTRRFAHTGPTTTLIAVIAFAAMVTRAEAQTFTPSVGTETSVEPSAQPGVCFQARPAPACGSFVIFGLTAQAVLDQTSRTVTHFITRNDRDGGVVLVPSNYQERPFAPSVGLEAGYAVNVGTDWAVGASAGVELGGRDPRLGLQGRLRRWLGSDYAVELNPGVFGFHRDGRTSGGGVGTSLEGRFVIADQGFFMLRWDRVSVDPYARDDSYSSTRDPGGTHHAISTGLGLSSRPALVGVGVLGAAYAALLGGFIAR